MAFLKVENVASPKKNFICGFGVGLSWGTAYFETDCIICPPIIEI